MNIIFETKNKPMFALKVQGYQNKNVVVILCILQYLTLKLEVI